METTEQKSQTTEQSQSVSTEQKLTWFTSRNTIVGGIIFSAIGLISVHVTSMISRKEHDVKKKVDNDSAKRLIDYRNQAQLDFLKKKYKLQAEYERQMKEPNREEVEFSIHNPSDYLGEEYELRPMVGYLLPENFDGILYGMKNTLKSYTAMGILIQLSLGEKPRILSPQEKDSYTSPENVYCIYADGENGGTVYKDRYHALGDRLDGKLEIIQSDTFGEDIDAFMSCVKNRCMLRPAGTKIVLCVDNIKSLFNDLSQSAGRKFLNELKKLRNSLRQYGISLTTLTVCHTEKSGDKLYGSYNTQCLAPVVLKLTEGDDYNHINLTLENTRTDLKGQTRSLVVMEHDYKCPEYDDAIEDVTSTSKEELQYQEALKIQEYLDAGNTKKAAAKHFGLSRPTIDNRLALLK